MICLAQGGEPSTIKRAKVDQELDQRLPGGVETVENRMRDPEQHNELKSVASTSGSSHDRRDKPGYDELPKEMNEMKIKDDKKRDGHEESHKVGFKSYFDVK